MLTSFVRKCSILICLFVMCPKRTVITQPPIQTLNSDLHTIARPDNIMSTFPPNMESIIKDNPLEATKAEEPGFDLTNEEIVKFKIWPQGVIPYYIDVYSYSDKVLRDKIRGFLNTVSSITSLNFLELPSPPDDQDSRWVFFINRRGYLGCGDHSTKNFTTKGVQKVILGYDCMSTGGEMAEAVLAIAGVPPQHNAPNRDNYIHVVDQNIMPDKKQLFAKLSNTEWLFHDLEYDFASASHYHPHKYSLNGKATIEMQEKYQDVPVGENNAFSSKDIIKIKMLYNFISRKKQNITECHKLFAPGINFDTYEPENVAIEPRKKPSLYTGIADSIVEENIEDDRHSSQMAEKQIAEEFSNNEKHEQGESPNESSAEKATIRPLSLKQQLSFKKDPLSYLSDYKSDEDGKVPIKMQPIQQLAFGKIGSKGKHKNDEMNE